MTANASFIGVGDRFVGEGINPKKIVKNQKNQPKA
jgi:hypothetical protein